MAYLIKFIWILSYALKQGQTIQIAIAVIVRQRSSLHLNVGNIFFLNKNEIIIINLYDIVIPTVQTHKSTALNAFCTPDPKTTGIGCKWYSMMWFFFLILWGRWYKSISTLVKRQMVWQCDIFNCVWPNFCGGASWVDPKQGRCS